MKNVTLKKRLLFISLACIFALGTLFICFRPKPIRRAFADANNNSLYYDGSPYSTVFTQIYSLNSGTQLEDQLGIFGGMNFQIENNFVLNYRNRMYKYYLFSNSYYTENNQNFYNTYFVGYNFYNRNIWDGDEVVRVPTYGVMPYSFSHATGSSPLYNSFRLIDSDECDMSIVQNYTGKTYSTSQPNSSVRPVWQDELGWYQYFVPGVTYYIIFFDNAQYSPSDNYYFTYYRALELYLSGNFNAVSKVEVSKSEMSFFIFDNNMFQGVGDRDGPDSVKFTYYAEDGVNYFSVNCYAYHTNYADLSSYDYSKYWYLDPPNLTDNQYYQSGFTQGYSDGYKEGLNVNSNESFTDGYNKGQVDGYNKGLIQGAKEPTQNAYDRGYEAGKIAGISSANDYTFLGLLGAVVDAPLTALTGLLNFDLLGFNMANFFYALVTCALIIFVVRLLL